MKEHTELMKWLELLSLEYDYNAALHVKHASAVFYETMKAFRKYRNAPKPLILEPDKPRTGVLADTGGRCFFYDRQGVMLKAIELTPEVRAALKAAGIEVEES